MVQRIAAGLCVLALGAGAGATGAGAQQVGIGLSGGQVTDELGGVHRALTASVQGAWWDDNVAARLHGQTTALLEGGWLGGGGISTHAVTDGLGPLRAALSAEAALGGSGEGYRAASARLSPRLRLAAAAGGVEGGPLWELGGQRSGATLLTEARETGGGLLPVNRREAPAEMRWAHARGLTAGAWGAAGPLSLRADWRHLRADQRAWREWTGSAALRAGDLTLGLSGGVRTGAWAGQWAAGSASLRLAESASLRVDAGRYPADPLMGRAAGSYASLGLSLSAGRGAGAVQPVRLQPPRAPDGRIRLSLRARPGARVELLGDWSDWKPVAVPEAQPGRYALDVALPEGTHRFLFRVDGEWRVPEGFETEPDSYGGRHAVLRVGQG